MGAWHPHPDVWALVGVVGAAYAIFADSTRRQKVLFGLGLATILVAADWPMHELSEGYWYSAHMVQHLLLTLVAAPLLLVGTPASLARALLRPRPVYVAFAQLTRPLPALVAFNAMIVLTHWPAVVDASVRSEPAHFAVHAALFASALLMWWPVASPLPELPRLSYPGRMLYLFLQSLVPTVPASFLTFGSEPLYKVYETFPRLLGLSALNDMRLAGLVMKLAGGAILWGVITVLFFRWHAEEQSEGWDALQFRDVERDVRAGLSKR